MQCLGEMWLMAERQSPGVVAVKDESTSRTYRDVMDRARRLAGALHARGVRKGDRVAMLSMNRTEWYDFYAACNITGYLATTVNFRLAPPEIAYILKDSAASVLIYEAQYQDALTQIRPQLESVRLFVSIGPNGLGDPTLEDLIAAGDPRQAFISIMPDDPAHLIYTSGTTGRPKGVIRSQRADGSNASELALFMGMSFGGSTLLMMPMFHVGAQLEAHGQILLRGTVVLLSRFDPVEVLRVLERERIDCTHMAPTMLQQVLAVPDITAYDLSHLRTICYAAAPMPVSVLKKGLELFGPIFTDCYGSTELASVTSLHKAYHRLDGSPETVKRLESVGQALSHCTIEIRGDDDVALPPGTIGEVTVKSAAALDGYWNNGPATMDSLRDGWFRTGDMGYLDDEGYLFLVDRKKDMIISGGENIYCREVEEALMAHPGVQDVAVIGVPDQTWGEAVKAVVVRNPGSTVTEDELIAHSRTLIAGYKRPRSVDFVEALPRLPSGKINKVELRAAYR